MTDSDPKPVFLTRAPIKGPVQFGMFLGSIGNVFFKAWILMLCLGGLHTQIPAIVPLGYWYSMIVVLTLNAALPFRNLAPLFPNFKDVK